MFSTTWLATPIASPFPITGSCPWPTARSLSAGRTTPTRASNGLMTVTAEEFLRRFLLHTLPRGFVRIRFCGFLANRRRRELLPLCQRLLEAGTMTGSATPATSEPKTPCGWLCPRCSGRMALIEKPTPQQIRRRSVERESLADTS